MPRTARLDIPGQLYHVTARGVERCAIFRDDRDREAFCSRLGSLLTSTGSACFAWALMSNHFHLLLRPGACGLAAVMRRLLTGHAVAFNRRHRRVGHLFQNRYHSILCDADTYLLPLVRYIHLNPLKVGLVDSLDALDSYPWCGHAVLMGQASLEGQPVEEVLALFAPTEKAARRTYRDFVAQGLADGEEQAKHYSTARLRDRLRILAAEEGGDNRILGESSLVETLMPEAARSHGYQLGLAELTDRVAGVFAISAVALRSRQRTAELVDARALLCALGVNALQLSGVKLADHLGQNRSSVSRAMRRGEQLLAERPELWWQVLGG